MPPLAFAWRNSHASSFAFWGSLINLPYSAVVYTVAFQVSPSVMCSLKPMHIALNAMPVLGREVGIRIHASVDVTARMIELHVDGSSDRW